MKQIIFPLLGNSKLLAVVILVHVFFAFFAVGGLILAVILERVGRGRSNVVMLNFARQMVHVLSDMMKVNGVLGVAIVVLLIGLWGQFAAWLYNITFWAFLTEGAGFLLLMIFTIAYRRTWDSKQVKAHEFYGIMAAFCAALTAFLINGIWSVMLMPGQWLKTQNPTDAFFNPVLWPSTIHLLIPTIINTAALLFIYTLWKSKQDSSLAELNQFFARVFASLIFIQPLSGLSFLFSLKNAGERYLMAPRPFDQIINGMAYPFFAGMVICAFVAMLCALFYWARGHEHGKAFLVIAVIAVFFAYFMGAFTREKARKPFLIHSFMYMNMQLVNAHPQPAQAQAKGAVPLTGAQIYDDNNCAVCHSLGGVGGTTGPALDHVSRNFKSIEDLKGYIKHPVSKNMPPDSFSGSDQELDSLARFLY